MAGQGLTGYFKCAGKESGLPCTAGASYAKSWEGNL